MATAQGAELLLEIRLEPTDPLQLAPPPPGLYPWSNAYEVRLTAQPGGRAIETLAVRGQLALVAGTGARGPGCSTRPTGGAWEPVESEPFGTGADQEAEITRTGTYLLVGPEQLLVESSGARSGGGWWPASSWPLILGLVVGLFQQRSYRRKRRQPGGGPTPTRPAEPSGCAGRSARLVLVGQQMVPVDLHHPQRPVERERPPGPAPRPATPPGRVVRSTVPRTDTAISGAACGPTRTSTTSTASNV